MTKRISRQAGFTLVELLVAIAVIVILVMITATIYTSVQKQTRNAQLADGADKIADAIQLFISKEGHFPRGGAGSTVAAAAGQECDNGANGWFYSTGYVCNVEDTLENLGYLPADFSTTLPPNTKYSGANRNAIMVYRYGTNKAMVYYSMEDSTANDTANFNNQMQRCGINIAGVVPQRDSYGMKNGICFVYEL